MRPIGDGSRVGCGFFRFLHCLVSRPTTRAATLRRAMSGLLSGLVQSIINRYLQKWLKNVTTEHATIWGGARRPQCCVPCAFCAVWCRRTLMTHSRARRRRNGVQERRAAARRAAGGAGAAARLYARLHPGTAGAAQICASVCVGVIHQASLMNYPHAQKEDEIMM